MECRVLVAVLAPLLGWGTGTQAQPAQRPGEQDNPAHTPAVPNNPGKTGEPDPSAVVSTAGTPPRADTSHGPVAPAQAGPPTPPLAASEQILSATRLVALDHRALARHALIAPEDSLRLALQTSLVTADGDLTELLGVRELELTDLVLLTLSGAYSVDGKVELLVAGRLAPKQPLGAGAPLFQRAALGARVGLCPNVAATLELAAGPTLGRGPGFAEASLGLVGRYPAARSLVFDGSVGLGGLALSRGERWAGLAEVLAGFDAILQSRGKAGLAIGVAFAFPFVTRQAMEPLRPQTRVNVHATGVVALAERWDLWLQIAVLDRGELSAPNTVLPVLDSGFDQRQLSLGVAYRSAGRTPDFVP